MRESPLDGLVMCSEDWESVLIHSEGAKDIKGNQN